MKDYYLLNKHFCLCLDEVLSRYDDNVKQGILPLISIVVCVHVFMK